MTTVEKIMLAGFIIMAFIFAVDLITGIVFGYIEGRQEAKREMKMDRILELIEKDFSDNIFPEFKDKR